MYVRVCMYVCVDATSMRGESVRVCVCVCKCLSASQGATFFYVLGLMYFFDCWTLGAYAYLALHGSYGFCWLLKEAVFPDPSWMRKVTVVSFFADFIMVCRLSLDCTHPCI